MYNTPPPPPPLGIEQAFRQAFDKLMQTSGRSRRSEFWWPILFVWLAATFFPLPGLALWILAVPLTFRRLHDTGHSGAWCIADLALSVVLGVMLATNYFLLIFTLLDSGATGDPLNILDALRSLLIANAVSYGIVIAALVVVKVLLIIFLCTDSQPHDNAYGPSPKYGPGERL